MRRRQGPPPYSEINHLESNRGALAPLYRTAWVTGTGLAVGLERGAGVSSTKVLLLMSLWTLAVLFGLPAVRIGLLKLFKVVDKSTEAVSAERGLTIKGSDR